MKPTMIVSYIKDPDTGEIKMGHFFFGKDEEEADRMHDKHLANCRYMQRAENKQQHGDLFEFTQDIDALPPTTEAELETFHDDLFGCADDAEAVDEDDDEDDEDEPET